MKVLKKILWLGAVLTAVAGLSLSTASCDKNAPDTSSSASSSIENSSGTSGESSSDSAVDSSSSGDEETTAFVYRVSVQNPTGFGFRNVTVNLSDGDNVIASKKTDSSGNANFLDYDVTEGTYTISFENLPAGYTFPDTTYQTGKKGTTTVISGTPTGLLEGIAPANTRYKLGDVMYDFTLTTSDNTTYTLSDVLQEKKLVLLNFWYDGCGPCAAEFPAMHDALIAYEESVSVIAVSTQDTKEQVANYKKNNGYPLFHMAERGSANLQNLFGGVYAVPFTVLIDRYGVIAYTHEGSLPSVSAFTLQFEKFVQDDYVPIVVSGDKENNNPSIDNPTVEQIKPTVDAPAISDLKNVFTTTSTSGFNFRFQENEGAQEGDENYDAYNWPWLISDDQSYIYASNISVNNSYSILYAKMTAKAGDVLTFEYKVGSEKDCDIFYVMLDGMIIQQLSGNQAKAWQNSYPYVFKDYEAGEHEIAFVYLKDGDTMVYEDVVQIKNLAILDVSEIESSSEDINIFRHAATQKNTDKNATTQFKNYVDVVLNEEDSYYHVGTKNGPVLYANMISSTNWSKYSVWMLAYSNYVVGDGMNFADAIEDFAWEATQVTTVSDYTPVTEDLKYILDAAARYVTVEQNFDGEYHENEWLEICAYWEHYGTAPMPADPMATITFTAAVPLKEGTEENPVANTVNVPYKIKPRGFKYKFVPEVSGAYKVYSTGKHDTVAFLFAEDRTTMLGYFDSNFFAAVGDENFSFNWYFNAGVTYYILCGTAMDTTATYEVFVERIGDYFVQKENAATLPYSFNEVTGEEYLPDSIKYIYADPDKDYPAPTSENPDATVKGDGYYHEKKADGSLGGIIYLDIARTTFIFQNASLKQILEHDMAIDEDSMDFLVKTEDRTFYFAELVEEDGIDHNGDGVTDGDYTRTLYKICQMDKNNDGFVEVTKEVFDFLQTMVMSDRYKGNAGIEESFLLLCYYDRVLDESNF